MSCGVTASTVPIGSIKWFVYSNYCSLGDTTLRLDWWEYRDSANLLLAREEDLYDGGCPAEPGADDKINAIMAPVIEFGKGRLVAASMPLLAANQRIRSIEWTTTGNWNGFSGTNWTCSGVATIETFECPDGEEPPPWGQPPYDIPGTPGTPEYPPTIPCSSPAELHVALVVDSHGVPILRDCAFPTFSYWHSPCDGVFSPPPLSVQVTDPTNAEAVAAAAEAAVRQFVPDARERLIGAGCGWPPALGPAARLDSPVTLHFSENLTGAFADASIDATFFSLVDLPVGGRYSLGDQLGPDDWYAFAVRDKSVQGGLVSYTGETLITQLGRARPRESLILVAGQGGVPAQLDLRECLRRFLLFYGVPFVDDLPGFYLRAGDQLVTPAVEAFVIQPNQETPESIYEWLERFFGPFRGYTFRADNLDRLVVTQPAWVDTMGLRLAIHRRLQALDREPVRGTVRAPWSTTRAPRIEWFGDVDGTPVIGSLPDPLTLGGVEIVTLAGVVDVRVTWDPGFVQVQVWPLPDLDVTVGALYNCTFIFRPDGAGGEVLELTDADLGQGEVLTTSADTVINQVVLPVRRREFTADQQLMQAAAMVVKSPKQLMAGAFGSNPEYGPMAAALATPSGFLELVNSAVQTGSWFWPADPAVVAQPGGVITVAVEVDEWAEQWRDPGSTPHAAAASVNTWSSTATLPASGVEVKLFDFQFPRQTSNLAPSPYGAQGSVYGRWRAGDQPGIELRLANGRFAEFGYLAELLGIFGQTVYFLWGAIVTLNGTGTTFTEGVLDTYRFGFARGDDGLWEGDANVPSLAESQAFFPSRVYNAPELPYTVSAETALAVARGIVEENLTPKTVYRLPVVPSVVAGWRVRPTYLGRAARAVGLGLGVEGRVVTVEYSEAHTAAGSTSEAFVEIEATTVLPGSRAATRHFGRAAYGASHYGLET